MKFSEMIERAKELLDKNDEDGQLNGVLGRCINTAYLTVARDKWRPAVCEKVSADEGYVDIKKLKENFISLKSAYDVNGFKMGAWAGKDYIHIPPWIKEATVEYYYLPKPMENDDDEPVIPEAQVDGYAYIYFAVARYLNIKHQHAEAAIWDARYRNITDNISETRGCRVMHVERWA